MFRRLLQLLIVALILQFTWGVASAYCGHETGKASQHVGHHQHQHKGAGGDKHNADNNASSAAKLGADPDCASCAYSPLGAFAFEHTALLHTTSLHDPAPAVAEQAAPYLGAPERPQWPVTA